MRFATLLMAAILTIPFLGADYSKLVPKITPVFLNEDESSVADLPRWVAGDEHDCECGDDCTCLSIACKSERCKKQYVVVFGASWCKHCPKMYPVVEELRNENFKVYYIDTDKYPNDANTFNVDRWPTTVVMDGGKEVVRFKGVVETGRIEKYLKKNPLYED